jgi:outer membrane beta-barrel protein
MKRLVLGLSFVVVVLGAGGQAVAQPPSAPAGESKPEAQPADAPAAAEPAGGAGTDLPGAITQTAPANPGEAARRTWQDVVVVPRKAFLKGGRLELFPMSGVTLNDVLIRHYSFGGMLNYYISDVFSIGVEGQYYIKERTDRESVIGLQYNRVASLNRYLYSGALNFGYVPGYGKFTLFNRYIIHWDLYVQGGVGLIQTEIIPRVVGAETFKNNRIAPNLGVGTHLFLSNWLTFNVVLKDYVFNDLFEPTSRTPTQSIDVVKGNAESQFVHNIMVFAGLGLYLPTSFQYRTPR